MEKGLQKYWFEFEGGDDLSPWLSWGCGVTGYSEDDCLNMIRQDLLEGADLPPIRKVIEGIDVSTLDEGHVLPNMGVPVWHGIWFPRRNV